MTPLNGLNNNSLENNITFASPAPWIIYEDFDKFNLPPYVNKFINTKLWFRDQQRLYKEQGSVNYTRIISQPLTLEGVREQGTLYISFAPQHQQVLIHHVHVYKDGKITDITTQVHQKLTTNNRQHLTNNYDGYSQVVLLLPGIKVNDIVDVAYSVIGTDPTVEGTFSGYSYWYAYDESYEKRLRILIPAHLKLHYNLYQQASAPLMKSATEVEGYQEYLWHNYVQKIEEGESNAPNWFLLGPTIQYSITTEWAEFSHIIARYFDVESVGGDDRQAINEIINNIKEQHQDEIGQIEAAIHFVRSYIRYEALDEPALTYRPNKLTNIITNQFGDCKDKTYLLLVLLNQLGITAYPALTSTSDYYMPPETLPALSWFNHIIVYLPYNNQHFWIDATIENDFYKLPDLIQFGGYGLILSPDYPKIVERPEDFYLNSKNVLEYDFKGGIEQPATLTLTSTYYRREASTVRYSYFNKGESSLKLACQQWADKHLPSGRLVEFIFQDDFAKQHSITIIEKFEITQPLKLLKDGFLYLYPAEMYRALKMIETPERSTPVEICYPAKIDHKIIVHTPNPLKPPLTQECEHACKSIAFKRRYHQEDYQITIDNCLETKQLIVWPAEAQEYYRVSKAIEDDFCYVSQGTLELKPKFLEKLKWAFSFKNEKFRNFIIWAAVGVGMFLIRLYGRQ